MHSVAAPTINTRGMMNFSASTSVDFVAFEKASKFFMFKIEWNCNFVALLHHSFWLQLAFGTFGLSLFNFLNYFIWLRITDEGFSTRNAHKSIMLIKSDLKWCVHPSRSLFLHYNYLGSITAGGPAHAIKFYGRRRLIRSIIRPSIYFSLLKLSEIVILWLCYTIPFAFSFFGSFEHCFSFLKLLILLRTSDKGSIPDIRIWSILLIKSD